MRASQLRIIEQQAARNQLASSSGFTARQNCPKTDTPWVPTLAIVFEYCWRYDKYGIFLRRLGRVSVVDSSMLFATGTKRG
jgi:hypothetical protein